MSISIYLCGKQRTIPATSIIRYENIENRLSVNESTAVLYELDDSVLFGQILSCFDTEKASWNTGELAPTVNLRLSWFSNTVELDEDRVKRFPCTLQFDMLYCYADGEWHEVLCYKIPVVEVLPESPCYSPSSPAYPSYPCYAPISPIYE